jgi:trimeric autotransporter adhesin
MKTKNITTLNLRTSIGRSPLPLAFLLVPLLLACFGLLPRAQAVSPTPDGDYPGANTAEGGPGALFSLTTGTDNTAVGSQALFGLTTGVQNTAVGAQALFNNTANRNTAEGFRALINNTTGNSDTANGVNALLRNVTGGFNTAMGVSALEDNNGSVNTALGANALQHNTTGTRNIALGVNAGLFLTTGSDNIDIANAGVAGESSTIRIGNSNVDGQNRAFIVGIRGVTTGNADAVPVVIDSDGQLGTAGSSRRFKKEIKPMEQASEAILSLKPVTFHYNSDKTSTPQFGLIAEEVAEVSPDLVVRDKNGEIYTVRYDAVNAMLLNEFLKEHNRVQDLETTVAQQAKGMEVLTAQLREQATQIQKVSAQVEMSKPTAKVVNNNK